MKHMDDERHDFVYVNPLLYTVLWLPLILVFAAAMLRFLGAQHTSPVTIVALALLGPALFFGYLLVLDKLLYPLFTCKGHCAIQGDGVELQFRYAKARLPYADIQDIHYRTLRGATCLTLVTRRRSHSIEQSRREAKYPHITPLAELYKCIEFRLWLGNKNSGSKGSIAK